MRRVVITLFDSDSELRAIRPEENRIVLTSRSGYGSEPCLYTSLRSEPFALVGASKDEGTVWIMSYNAQQGKINALSGAVLTNGPRTRTLNCSSEGFPEAVSKLESVGLW